MKNEDIITYLKEENERIYGQLSYAETKNAVLIGFVGGAIFAIIGIIIDLKDTNLLWLQILLGIISFSLFLSLFISLLSFYPNRKTLNPNRKNNLYFYGDIANYKNADDYLKDLSNCEDMPQQLAEQNIAVSSIIVAKHNKFELALKLCIASFIYPFYLFIIIESVYKRRRK